MTNTRCWFCTSCCISMTERLRLQKGSFVANTSQKELCSWELHSFFSPASPSCSEQAQGLEARSVPSCSAPRAPGAVRRCDGNIAHQEALPSIQKLRDAQWNERSCCSLLLNLTRLGGRGGSGRSCCSHSCLLVSLAQTDKHLQKCPLRAVMPSARVGTSPATPAWH